MPVRVIYNGKQLGPQFRRGAKRDYDRVARSVTSAVYESATVIRKRGAADIKSSGNFGSRWTRGLRTRVSPPRGQFSVDAQIIIDHDLQEKGARLFEYGGVVRGKPLLWIPLSFARDAKGIRARDYPQPLFRVDRLGKAPLLMTVEGAEPKYFGKESITMPRKWHLRDIGRSVARGFQKVYNKYFKLYRDL